MDELLSQPKPPTAVICSGDAFALMVLDYCEKKEIKIPDDLAVTGYDNIGISSISEPPLTTIDSRVELQSRTVVHLLEKRLGGIDISDAYITIDPVLVIRKTV
jgi:LacI family repressor for deo operon, udp, cdd, tsx, nupC, and nupG